MQMAKKIIDAQKNTKKIFMCEKILGCQGKIIIVYFGSKACTSGKRTKTVKYRV